MAGAMADFDFLQFTNKANYVTNYNLSTDQQKAGAKSLCGPTNFSGLDVAILHKTNTVNVNGNRFLLWILRRPVAAGDFIKNGMCYGMDIAGASVNFGVAGYLMRDDNWTSIRILYSANGTLTLITTKNIIALTEGQWYLLEFIVSVESGIAYCTLNIYDTDGTTLIDTITGNRVTTQFGSKYGMVSASEDVWNYVDEFYVYE